MWTLFHSYAFDFSVWELWGALLYGGRLVVVPYWVSRVARGLPTSSSARGRERPQPDPSAFRAAVPADVDARRRLPARTCCGGCFRRRACGPWFYERYGDQLAATLVNMYGITETTVHVDLPADSRTKSSAAPEQRRSACSDPRPRTPCYVLDPQGAARARRRPPASSTSAAPASHAATWTVPS